jgi:hypothetical protein
MEDENKSGRMEPFMKERMDALLKKMRERSRKRILRLMDKGSYS